MRIADLIRSMSAAGAPPEAIALAVEAIEAGQARDEERRAKQAARKARSRARERDSHGTVTGQSPDSPEIPVPLLLSPRTPLITTPNPGTHTHTAPGARADAVAGFEPSPADVAALAAEGLGAVDIAAELPPFRDHWLASHDPLPADLGAAFRGFCRHGRGRRKPPRAAGQGARASPIVASVEAVSVNGVRVTPGMVAQAVAGGRWPKVYGPGRGEAGCQIPAHWFGPERAMAEA